MKLTWNSKNIAALLFVIHFSCQEWPQTTDSIYKYIEPNYKNIHLTSVSDTISFSLNEQTYNSIKSFNTFLQNGCEFISFYDERSQSINIYQFQTRELVKKIKLKKLLKTKSFYKTTVYCKNFDSIFINNMSSLYLVDHKGTIKKSIDFVKEPRNASAIFENACPLVVKGNKIYVCVRPSVEETSYDALKKWKVLYGFNLKSNEAKLFYHLPKNYQQNLYGYHFLGYNYCLNNNGNFVFSFPADTLIYETNLTDYHVAYYAKSRFQKSAISPINIEYLKGKDLGYKQYKLRDSYGPIFFDPYRKWYLRQAKQKIGESDYDDLKMKRKESVIVLNEDFKIIGESEITDDFSFSSLFFSSEGSMYGRVNSQDEYALHFVRLEYKEYENEVGQLTKTKFIISKQK
jgi:hypothetical protein